MWINESGRKQRKLSREILGILTIILVVALLLMHTLDMISIVIIDHYLVVNEIVLSEAEYIKLEGWVFNLSLIAAVVFFIVLFLFLLGERLSYIREILAGIDALREGQEDYVIPLEGNNELTQLAESVNYLSKTQRKVKEKERELSDEKEAFIHAMSHDIRTPLTTIMAYSELMSGENTFTPEEQIQYLKLIQHKAEQIKDMTDILLDDSRRNPEYLENASILLQQLTAEFEEALEDNFIIEKCIQCPSFSGTFDVRELQRIFDNLISNVQKYADPASPVKLFVSLENSRVLIQQENAFRKLDKPVDGYQIGLKSIRRIAQNYGGLVEVQQDGITFSIKITL